MPKRKTHRMRTAQSDFDLIKSAIKQGKLDKDQTTRDEIYYILHGVKYPVDNSVDAKENLNLQKEIAWANKLFYPRIQSIKEYCLRYEPQNFIFSISGKRNYEVVLDDSNRVAEKLAINYSEKVVALHRRTLYIMNRLQSNPFLGNDQSHVCKLIQENCIDSHQILIDDFKGDCNNQTLSIPTKDLICQIHFILARS